MTNSTPKTLRKIRQAYSSFHGNYIRIADQILRNPGLLIRDKVSDVAAACDCDSAQIIRFCQKLGFKGFTDMKRAISHDFIPLQTQVDPESIGQKKGFQRLISDFRNDYIRTVNDTATMFEEETITAVVRAVRNAKKILICGTGASGIVAEDFQMKLVRMGYPVFQHSKPTMNKMMCSLMDKNDLLIAISFSGESADTLNYVRNAAKNGCKIAAITNYPNSPLAKIADYPLITAAEENDFRIGAMTSRLSQLMTVDILAIMLALKDAEKTERNLAKTHNILHENKEERK